MTMTTLFMTPVAEALHSLSESGIECFFAHGNRDFLIGEGYSKRSGMTLLDEYTVVEVGGRRVLLTHGDALCTDDTEYMAFRTMVRDPAWQEQFLSQSLDIRLGMAAQARDQSKTSTAGKSMDIMDVNQGAVERVMGEHGVTTLLHGHTHRPGIHSFKLGNQSATRIVLGDWYRQGSVGCWDEDGFTLRELPR